MGLDKALKDVHPTSVVRGSGTVEDSNAGNGNSSQLSAVGDPDIRASAHLAPK